MSTTNIKEYSRKYLESLNDDALLLLLKNSWGIPDTDTINVIARIKNYGGYDSVHFRIYDIKVNNELYTERPLNFLSYSLKYPLENVDYRENIKEGGIYVPPNFKVTNEIKTYIKNGGTPKIYCELVLASKKERKKKDNPLLLSVNANTTKILYELKKGKIINDENGNLLIEKTIIEYHIQLKKQEIDQSINEFREKVKNEEQELTNIIKKEELKTNKILKSFEKKIKKLSNEETKKQKSVDEFEEVRAALLETIQTKKNDIYILDEKIDELKKIFKSEDDIVAKKLEKLRTYIKDKANILLDLEFIDQEEYDNLLMINKDFNINEKFVDFENDLQSDKQKAISHIQAYLFEQDIVYPRYILEDFLALIQTNDLIILAGESGSGKTNLVKSFAKAVGGKSFIIPVKPNWTSSEDLLGYYNPLERKYLTTPFLEALLEAKDNPDIPYFICLDEMNLARVEYYFADFLSLLEERDTQPEIKLYSEDESSHILSEIKNVIDTIDFTKEKYKKKDIVNFMKLLQDEEINKELTRIFGFSDKDSLIKYHTDLRRMLSGILNTPSSITFPKNVRIIGAINIDETTHYLSPKILDRAHIMKFDSPLLQNWDAIETEIKDVENKDLKIKFKIEDLGIREDYPSFTDNKNDKFCKIIMDMTEKHFSPIGIEVGLRTIRQGLNYQKIFIEQGSDKELVINNFILHKILPKMTFDGSKSVKENVTKKNMLLDFKVKLEAIINREDIEDKGIYVIDEINKIVANAESNDEIVNYWA